MFVKGTRYLEVSPKMVQLIVSMDTVVIKKSGKVLEALPHILLFFVNLQRLVLI